MLASQTVGLGSSNGVQGSSGDITKFADEYSEKIITELIQDYSRINPEKKVILVSEETGIVEFGNIDSVDGFFIILDPLDGSNNIREWRTPSPYVGVGFACGSLETLANKDNFDAVEVAYAMDIFNNRIYYSSLDSVSSVVDFGTIQTSPIQEIEEALIGSSFDYKQDAFERVWSIQKDIMLKKKCQRRLGSSILDFCKVAAGEYDAFISLGGKMGFYDLAAVKMIIEHAGGVFEILTGQTDFCIIKKIIETKDSSLLGTYKYEVLASANSVLHTKLRLGGKKWLIKSRDKYIQKANT